MLWYLEGIFITPCEHSYWLVILTMCSLHSYKYISSSLKQYSRCPLCNEPMTSADSLIPNVTCKSISVPSLLSFIPLCSYSEWSYLQISWKTRSRTSSWMGGDIAVYTSCYNVGSAAGSYTPEWEVTHEENNSYWLLPWQHVSLLKEEHEQSLPSQKY